MELCSGSLGRVISHDTYLILRIYGQIYPARTYPAIGRAGPVLTSSPPGASPCSTPTVSPTTPSRLKMPSFPVLPPALPDLVAKTYAKALAAGDLTFTASAQTADVLLRDVSVRSPHSPSRSTANRPLTRPPPVPPPFLPFPPAQAPKPQLRPVKAQDKSFPSPASGAHSGLHPGLQHSPKPLSNHRAAFYALHGGVRATRSAAAAK
jgi:hypothetical protein